MKAAERRTAAVEVDLAVAARTIREQRRRLDEYKRVVESAVSYLTSGNFTEALDALKGKS